MGVTYGQLMVTTCVRALIWVALAVAVSACSEDGQAYVCEPGELQACPCLDGPPGVQTCADDRQGWMDCQCEVEQGDGPLTAALLPTAARTVRRWMVV